MSLVMIVVALLIILLLGWALQQLLRAFSVGDPIRTVVYVIYVLLVVLWLLGAVGLAPNLRLR